jgi:anti-anti-sigma regulatory factor
MSLSPDRAKFHLAHREPGRALLEVEGSLDDAVVVRWRALLRGLIAEGRRNIAIDLRGCRVIGDHCLDALLAASAAAKASGGEVGVVTLSGSPVAQALAPHHEDLHGYASVQAMLAAWEEGHTDRTGERHGWETR